MKIKFLQVENFKSFRKIEVNLNNFNVLIGANASGKSNFIQILKFLRDTSKFGLENAVSIQGGADFFCNLKIGTKQYSYFKIIMELPPSNFFLRSIEREQDFALKYKETEYEFSLQFVNNGQKCKVLKDKLVIKFETIKDQKNKKLFPEEKQTIEFVLEKENERINYTKPENINTTYLDLILESEKGKLGEGQLLLSSDIFYFLTRDVSIQEIAFYDLNPKTSKNIATFTGTYRLEENGNNLSFVLQNILSDSSQRKKFYRLLKNLLPYVKDISFEILPDKMLIMKLNETFFKKRYIPASFISEGTVQLIALIVALYFQKNQLVIIEEPERNIHPTLIQKLVEMLKDASREKQILISTHNPEVVKYSGIDSLLLISRDSDGFSNVIKPSSIDYVKNFLKNEIGIEELFVQNLL